MGGFGLDDDEAEELSLTVEVGDVGDSVETTRCCLSLPKKDASFRTVQ